MSFKVYILCDFCGEQTEFNELLIPEGCSMYPAYWRNINLSSERTAKLGDYGLKDREHICPDCVQTLKDRKKKYGGE